MLTNEELKAITDQVGKEAGTAMQKKLEAYEATAKRLAEEAATGKISQEVFEAHKVATDTTLAEIKQIAEKQGTTLAELAMKVQATSMSMKSIAEVLKDDEDELRKIHTNRHGVKEYMLTFGAKGEPVLRPHDRTKTGAGPIASIAGVNGGAEASIFQSIDAASLLRLGGESMIISQYRNHPWIFDLCNLINADYNTLMAMWYEEQPKLGASSTVAEGATKPASQYMYTLKTASYKKEATLIGFTEEFNLDFPRLQSDIMGKGRIDVINRINTAVLGDLIAAATPYNTGGQYTNNTPIQQYNDYLAIDALAAQVDNATFGWKANGAIMSTFKHHRVNTQLNQFGDFLQPPAALAGVAMIGNPAMATDSLVVGDFKQYNIILRGGLILRIGYQGTDFAQNMFSTVLEQYYFDYISAIRAIALVSGPTFSAIKAAIAA